MEKIGIDVFKNVCFTLDKMRKGGIRRNSATYNTILVGLYKKRAFDDIMHILRHAVCDNQFDAEVKEVVSALCSSVLHADDPVSFQHLRSLRSMGYLPTTTTML